MLRRPRMTPLPSKIHIKKPNKKYNKRNNKYKNRSRIPISIRKNHFKRSKIRRTILLRRSLRNRSMRIP